MKGQTVLILDDDQASMMALALIIRREGFRAVTASRAEEALACLERERIAVVISDLRLPDTTGIEFLQQVRQRWPDAIRIILTAYADTATALAAINEGHVYRFLTKPWQNDELRSVLQDSVRFHELIRENQRLYTLNVSQSMQLRQLNEELEKKVAQRTAEIEYKNTELEENLLDIIRLLASVQELRNSSLAGHAQRMADAALWVASALEVSESEQRDVEIAALVHDIGMLGLPDHIFHKETFSLKREEQELVRQSPLLGEGLLATIPRLRQVAKIVRHQGEFYNGTGFPDGLSGEAIPVGSRIIAVIEAYERFGGREVLTQSDARRFDPRVVREFLRYLDERRVAAQTGVELRLAPLDLMEGMVLTRDLYSGRGLLLATSGKVVDQATLDKIRNFHRVDPIEGKVYVHV